MDPREMLNDPEKIKDMIAMLQALLPQTDGGGKPQKVAKTKKTERVKTKITQSTKTNRAKKTKEPASTNKFLEMQEMYMHKDDAAIDKKLSKNAPIPRTRHFRTITVKCRVCGRSEEVNPGLVYDASRYKCNNCSSAQG